MVFGVPHHNHPDTENVENTPDVTLHNCLDSELDVKESIMIIEDGVLECVITLLSFAKLIHHARGEELVKNNFAT